MLKEVKTTVEHVEHILTHLSEQNRSELEALGLNTEEALLYLEQYLELGEAETGLVEGEPVAVFGVLHAGTTWFVATDKFWNLGLAGVRFARRYLKRNCKTALFSCSMSSHPDVERWFMALGFECLGGEGAAKWFKWEPKAPISSSTASVTPEVAAPDTLQSVE
jgi:hypothetical protein